jgi:alkylation response protein AidB-like acyl-CoA dehydrogenase
MNPPPPAQEPSPSLPLVPSDEETMLRETVFGIASGYGHEYFAEVTRAGEAPTALWRELSAGGFTSVHLPEEFGGGLGLSELAIVAEEVAAAGCPLLIMAVSPAIVGTLLARFGTTEQRQRWLAPLAGGEILCSFAITEPDAGSNSHQLKTRARRDGDGWRLNGTKTFISGVEDAAAILVVARTGEDERGRARLSLFIVDPDAPGLERQLIPTVLEAPERQWTLFFDDVELGPDRLLGEEGAGLRSLFLGLNPERIISAAICNGVGRYALAKASRYANERAVWGVPIGSHQGVSHPLAEAKIQLELARLMTRRAGALHDAGLPAGESSNMAKFSAAEAGVRCVDQAIQAHGGNGFAREYQLADLYWVVRLLRTVPVSREMILNFVAEHSLGLPKSY